VLPRGILVALVLDVITGKNVGIEPDHYL
jgi:hypothetical protein